MHKFSKQLVSLAALATVLITGCGGGSDPVATSPAPSDPAVNIDMNVSALVSYLNGIIPGTGDTNALIDVNALTLAVDDTAAPVELN